MKRSISSLLASLALLGFALSAPATTYSGTGTWKSSDGKAGEYTVGAHIEALDEEVSIKQTLDFGNKVLNINVLIHKIDETFFNVINGDTYEVIGEGYCFPLGTSDESKICHSESFTGDDFIEGTIKITPTAIYRIGSKTNALTGDKVIWKDLLEPSAQE